MTTNENPQVPSQRNSEQSESMATTNIPATFLAPRTDDGRLDLSWSPENNRRWNKKGAYTLDLENWAGTLTDELRTAYALIDELTRGKNDFDRVEQGLRDQIRQTNTAMDGYRSSSNRLSTINAVQDEISATLDSAVKVVLRTAYDASSDRIVFDVAGLQISYTIGGTVGYQLMVDSTPGNPVKIQTYFVRDFTNGGMPSDADLRQIVFLAEAATPEGYEQNRKRFKDNSNRLSALYQVGAVEEKYSCGHTRLEHVKQRKQLLASGAPAAIIEETYSRLNSLEDPRDHTIELLRATRLYLGGSKANADAIADVAYKLLKEKQDGGKKHSCGHTDKQHEQMFGSTLSEIIKNWPQAGGGWSKRSGRDNMSDSVGEYLLYNYGDLDGGYPGKVYDDVMFGDGHDTPGEDELSTVLGIIFPEPRSNDASYFGVTSLQNLIMGLDVMSVARQKSSVFNLPVHTENCRNGDFDINCGHPSHYEAP